YDVVVTNPPYMGGSGMNGKLSEYVKKNYPNSKSDLFSVFMEFCGRITKQNGYQAMITQHAWMFLSSFEKLREKLLLKDIVNMAHLGARAFDEIGGEVVQTTSFVLRNSHLADYKGTYCRLIEPISEQGKEDLFLSGEKRYTAQQSNFFKIPGNPVAYWISEQTLCLFLKHNLSQYVDARNGMSTTDNNRFLRFWFECNFLKICFCCRNAQEALVSKMKWFPYNKGGSFRRWYGNNDYVVNWENDGAEMKTVVKKNYGSYSKELRSEDRYFQQGITWSCLSSGKISMRV